jgi:hypothetical protein
MTDANRVDALLDRVATLEWNTIGYFAFPRSRTHLMREHLRRSAWWAQLLGVAGKWPLFDIPSLIDPDFVERFETMVDRVHLHTVLRLEAALRRAAMPDGPADPYAPLVVRLERGGPFGQEHGGIELYGGTLVVRRTAWRDHLVPEPLVGFDPAELDELDRQFFVDHPDAVRPWPEPGLGSATPATPEEKGH